MKPLITGSQDEETLRTLGSASVQIVHDLKNQLNGLKLYATFLRKRMEKSDRPQDELDTISKLIGGLERAAGDMTLLVRYGRPLELRRQPRTDLARLVEAATDGAALTVEPGEYEGEFDAPLLSEALTNISAGSNGAGAEAVQVLLRREPAGGGAAAAVIEWRGVAAAHDGDAFKNLAGGQGLRLALAAKIIRAHGGEAAQDGAVLHARLPLQA
ncbi:MAG TPA: hypothetical protein VD968_14235 [Pyrinomonadaceae bacterium]|nr:hypothetical protein [Pyrinomonadaceae bacterium]